MLKCALKGPRGKFNTNFENMGSTRVKCQIHCCICRRSRIHSLNKKKKKKKKEEKEKRRPPGHQPKPKNCEAQRRHHTDPLVPEIVDTGVPLPTNARQSWWQVRLLLNVRQQRILPLQTSLAGHSKFNSNFRPLLHINIRMCDRNLNLSRRVFLDDIPMVKLKKFSTRSSLAPFLSLFFFFS
jgi:hypothetical protein